METIIFDPRHHHFLLLHFAGLHTVCIGVDHTIATFIPPLNHTKIESWWQEQAAKVVTGKREIIFVLETIGEQQFTGVVMLSKPQWETGPFRGYVEKLLVSPDCRRMGVARVLMRKLEEVARGCGRTLLMLDTETGSPAETMYPKLGYTKVGVVPSFGSSPEGGSLRSETFFYKDLMTSRPIE